MLVSPISKILLYRNNQLAVKIAIVRFSCLFQFFYQMFRDANRCFDHVLFGIHMHILSAVPLYKQGSTRARSRCTLMADGTHRAIQMLALFRFKPLFSTLTDDRFLKIPSSSVGEWYKTVFPSYPALSLYPPMTSLYRCVLCFPL